MLTGNMAMAMGGAAAGVKFYCAYPMSPSTGVLHGWPPMPASGIMVRQVEDEIGVMNMAIGAAHAGMPRHVRHVRRRFRADDRGSGHGGNDRDAGGGDRRSARRARHRCPHQDRAGRLWQMLGAGQGDYPRLIAAPTDIWIASKSFPRSSISLTSSSVPGIVLADLLISEGTRSVDPDDLDFKVEIDRGELITANGNGPTDGAGNGDATSATCTPRAASPRAPSPACPATFTPSPRDEHDEDGVLISDEFTNPTSAAR